MLVVDVRNRDSQRNIEVIEITDESIYYYEEKNNSDKNSLCLFEYNISDNVENLMVEYTLDDPTLIPHAYSFEDSIMLVLENGRDVFVLRIDKSTYDEHLRTDLNCIGQFSDCKPLDQTHILIYTVESEEFSNIFKGYKEATGCSFIVYLYDLNTQKKYVVKDCVLRRLFAENLHIFKSGDSWEIMLLDPYSSEYLKESYYKESSWIDIDVKDNVWILKLDEFIGSIKSGEEKLPSKLLINSDINGSVRFIGYDKEKIYFKQNYFSLNKQEIKSFSKATNKIVTETEFYTSVNSPYKYLHISKYPFKIHMVSREPNYISVKGVLNSTLDANYNVEFGDFLDCIEDRFIICKSTLNRKRELITIYDPVLETKEHFACKFFANENTSVLY